MHDLIVQLESLGRGMWKYRWQGVIIAWIAAAIGVVIVFRMPDKYEASARIYVDTQSILRPLMAGLAVQPNIDQQVAMLSRTLISRPNVEKLIRMADLDLKNRSKAEQDATIERVMASLAIGSAGRDNLYTLSYRDSEPERAKRAVQSLVSIFVESSLGASRKDTGSAKVFLDEQIKAYRAKLEEAEARLKDFRIRNLEIKYSGDGKDAIQRINEINGQLEQAKLELREAEDARNAAKAAIDAERGGAPGAGASAPEVSIPIATPEIDARLDAQKRNLDSLLQRFTEQHPDVLATRRIIRELEEQKKHEVAELRKQAAARAASGVAVGTTDYAAQGLKSMLAASDAQVAALRARVGEYAARLNQAKADLKTAPQLEAEATQLNRDYNIHKKNYEDLVARREAANMSEELDGVSGLADFRLIDPPRVSPKPVSPNRPLLLALALVASLAAGLAWTFAAGQLRPVFFRDVDLRQKVDVPLLGVVSMVLSDGDRRRERADMLRFAAASGSLVGVFLVGLTVMSFLLSR